MAQQHDLFDDIIDISKGLGALKDPFSGVTDALLGTEGEGVPQWNPADYKEKPRANSIPCLVCNFEKSSCTACRDACPVNAIDIEEYAIEIGDVCRKCGLCVAACPTEALVSPRIAPKKLYDAIAGAAAPLVSFLLSGMPMLAMLPLMMVELCAYGLVAGLLRGIKLPSLAKVVIAQLAGRVVLTAATAIAVFAFGSSKAIAATWTSDLAAGLPGLALQWALIPLAAYWTESLIAKRNH